MLHPLNVQTDGRLGGWEGNVMMVCMCGAGNYGVWGGLHTAMGTISRPRM